MSRRLLLVLMTLACPAVAQAQDQTINQMPSYPVNLDPNAVYAFPELTIKSGKFQLTSGAVSVVPISCERGITGAMLIGDGTFRFEPEGGAAVEGHFRSAMLRFNPDDQAAILPLEKGKKGNDRGACEMARHLMQAVFGHCWHRGQDALIPPKGSITAVLYSKEHGDLLITDGGPEVVVHNFTEKRTLFEKTAKRGNR